MSSGFHKSLAVDNTHRDVISAFPGVGKIPKTENLPKNLDFVRHFPEKTSQLTSENF